MEVTMSMRCHGHHRRVGSSSSAAPGGALRSMVPAIRRRQQHLGTILPQNASAAKGKRRELREKKVVAWGFNPLHIIAPLPKESVQEGTSVYVALPSNAITSDGKLAYPVALPHAFAALSSIGVDGVSVRVMWGLVERTGPKQYDFSVYREMADMLQTHKLKMQVILDFSACAGVTGLPCWVYGAGKNDPDIFFRDQYGNIIRECLSLGVDEEPAIQGRSGREIYRDLMQAFRDEFAEELGRDITEVTVGTGPHAELRYPSYPQVEGDGRKWHFPGIGEFQSYDKRMQAKFKEAATIAGYQDYWGDGKNELGVRGGPRGSAGHYCSRPMETGFFSDGGTWRTPEGRFFLEWYSSELLGHGKMLLSEARGVFKRQVVLGIRVPVVHWWAKSESHAAELTAGVYTTSKRNGYADFVQLAADANAFIEVSCAEMRSAEQPVDALCGPEEVIDEIRQLASESGVPVGLENCVERFDDAALEKLLEAMQSPIYSHTKSICYVAMSDEMFKGRNWIRFTSFVSSLRPDLTLQHAEACGPIGRAGGDETGGIIESGVRKKFLMFF